MKRRFFYIITIISCFLFTSCACYHCPRVYRNRASLPKSVAVPYYKNTKQNKYGPNKPYYGEPKKKKKRKKRNR